MNETLWSHSPQKQAYTHAHRYVSHDNESSLNTLQNSCLTMGYVQLSSLTPVWECLCVCVCVCVCAHLWVRDPTTHGSRHHNGTQISTSQTIIISCQATRKTHIERPVLVRWPYKLISIIKILCLRQCKCIIALKVFCRLFHKIHFRSFMHIYSENPLNLAPRIQRYFFFYLF